MAIFKIFEHPSLGIKAVKEGISWPAFSTCFVGLGFVWFAINRFWVRTFIAVFFGPIPLALAAIALISGHSGVSVFISFVYLLFIWFVPGAKGNSWIENSLISQGYKFKMKLPGQTSNGAIAAYLSLIDKRDGSSQSNITEVASTFCEKAVMDSEKTHPSPSSQTFNPNSTLLIHPTKQSPNIEPMLTVKLGEAVVSYPFYKDQIIVGRLPDSDIKLDDLSISGKHALLKKYGHRFFISDLESSNGTFLNGHQINGETEFRVGDSICMGGCVISLAR